MKNELLGWIIIGVTLAIPFNKMYFQLSEITNFEKALYFIIALAGLGIGYVIIGNAKAAKKKSH